jgi:hypothetical protein
MFVPVFATAILSLGSIARAVAVDKKFCEGGPWMSPTKAGMPWESTPEGHYFCEAGHTDGNVLTGT